MRTYSIFLVEEEFASHYFGKESKLYHLFLEFQRAHDYKKDLLKKQIDFVTRTIPALPIHQVIEQSLKVRTGYKRYRSGHYLTLTGTDSQATLVVNNHYIELEAEGSIEVETIFFEALRKFDPCFLAIDFTNDRYGWLNPVKQRKFV